MKATKQPDELAKLGPAIACPSGSYRVFAMPLTVKADGASKTPGKVLLEDKPQATFYVIESPVIGKLVEIRWLDDTGVLLAVECAEETETLTYSLLVDVNKRHVVYVLPVKTTGVPPSNEP